RGVLPGFGNAAGKYFLEQSNWPYNTGNKEVTYNLFHHHGDAFMTVYSEIPQNLTVNHSPSLYAGYTSFDVLADEGSLIALTVNGEIIGTAEGTGATVSITIPAQVPPNQMVVTITKQNYYRYEAFVEIIPLSGPFIVQESYEINDEAGNNNGLMDTGESVLISLTVENVGSEQADNVTVSIATTDSYITITDDTENYGNIASGATATVTDGFAWDVHDDIPDMHLVTVEVNATDGDETWTTYFDVEGHAPILEIGNMTIDDASGNGDGRLDPGETADIIIETYNNGSCDALGAIGALNTISSYITLNNTTHDFNVIGYGLMEEAVFNVTVDDNTPIGSSANLHYFVESGSYNAQKDFTTSIGLLIEDWETGDMSQYEWQTGGDASWFVSQQNPYEGIYCAQSGDIDNNQSSWLSLEYEVLYDDSISFWFKVSSESDEDFLQFYIDSTMQEQWSGEVGWQKVAYAISEGTHIFEWVYDKNWNTSIGSDCTWIDFIILPPPPMTTAYAGQDDEICEGDDYQCQGIASFYNAIHWTGSGSGTFDNSLILTPVYTPSADDITNGSVILTVTAYSIGNNVSDDMLLTINTAPVANAGADANVCENDTYFIADASAENYVSVKWVTAGDGTFDDNYIINPVYTPGSMDILNGTVTLTFSVTGNEPCGDTDDDMVLTFEPAPEASAGNDGVICSDDTYYLENATAQNYASILWTSSGNGTFDDATNLNPTYTPGENDISAGSATLTITAAGNGTCDDAVSDLILTIEAAPVAYAGEDNQINNDETYTIEDATAENYFSVLWEASGDGTFNDDSSVNPTYTPGLNDIEAEEVILTITVNGNDPCGTASDDMLLNIHTIGVIENAANFNISIFPNPNTGSFTVELSSENNELVNISIFNSLSKVIYEQKNIRINGTLSETININVEQGIYYMKITGNNILINKKVIIRK
ncbi:MAG: T9SS type A sorting domain-containing protein, partial [Bacteroidales bacterium]|nr:T9SS type A sorting domain-containing protein [Bacteroidales bacterium]